MQAGECRRRSARIGRGRPRFAAVIDVTGAPERVRAEKVGEVVAARGRIGPQRIVDDRQLRQNAQR